MLLNINVYTETIMSCVRTEAASSFCKLHNGQFSLVNLEKNLKTRIILLMRSSFLDVCTQGNLTSI